MDKYKFVSKLLILIGESAELSSSIEDIYHISFDLWLEKWIKTCPELGTKDCFIRIELKEYKEE